MSANESSGFLSNSGGLQDAGPQNAPEPAPEPTKLPWWREVFHDEIVISGISGRFPEADNIQEFADNLFGGVDMITENSRRWMPGWNGLPPRSAKLKNIHKFDAQFFSILPKQAAHMDPQLRMLLEVVQETILDAGFDPQELRGSRTGVFVGVSASETESVLGTRMENASGYILTGCCRSMFANRVSYAFDLRGPSFPVDTACSSSLLAFQLAVDAIRQGQCEAAIVAGTHLNMTPTCALSFNDLNMLSHDGVSRSFDNEGTGYVRSETVSAILLQKATDARRIYAIAVHAKSSNDGFKEAGITVPSGEQQAILLDEFYHEADVDPSLVCYVEAHGTGTPVGDPQEAHAITQTFCKNRTDPLLIGSVKSNMGHPEPAAGICQIAKVVIAFQKGEIPPNLNYREANAYIPALQDGRLKVVTKTTPFEPGFVAINSFGFGGANTHVLLKAFDNRLPPSPYTELDDFPRMIFFSGRTKDAVEKTLENSVAENRDFKALLAEVCNLNPTLNLYRGYALNDRALDQPIINVQKVQRAGPDGKRPIWFVYAGMGAQWAGMARQLLHIDTFRLSLMRCAEATKSYGIDPFYVVARGTGADLDNVVNAMVTVTAIQVALTDLLHAVGIQADGMIGHSTGEILCGYADGGLTRSQTVLCAYFRAKAIVKKGLNRTGAMAAVGLSWQRANDRVPAGVVAACHNSADSVTVSGDRKKVEDFVDEMKAEGIFAKMVNSANVAFHSPELRVIELELSREMEKLITHPKKRSSRWISTSTYEGDWTTEEMSKYCSAEYQVNNMLSPVLFHGAVQKIPNHAVIIEIAPHTLFASILRRSVDKSCSMFGLMKLKTPNEIQHLLTSIGSIYQAGITVRIDALYQQKSLPVPINTPFISSLVGWDHSADHFCVSVKEKHILNATSTAFNIEPFNPESPDHFLVDHVIDGHLLFPFAGYIWLAWKAVARYIGVALEKVPIIVENFTVHQPSLLSKQMLFELFTSPTTGKFEVCQGSMLLANGVIRLIDRNNELDLPQLPNNPADDNLIKTAVTRKNSFDTDCIELDGADIYKELLVRGYDYKAEFQGLHKINTDTRSGQIKWTGNWVTFIDACIQSWLLVDPETTLRLPTALRHLRIDPEEHLKSVRSIDGEQSLVSIQAHVDVGGCVAGGVQLLELRAASAQRRKETKGKLHMDHSLFLPYKDQECLRYDKATMAELSQYTDTVRNLLAELSSRNIKDEAYIRLRNAIGPLPMSNKRTVQNNATLSGPLCSLYSELRASESFDSDFFAALAKKYHNTLNADMLYGGCFLQYVFEPFQHLTFRNIPGNVLKLCYLFPQDSVGMWTTQSLADKQPAISLSWTLIDHNLDHLDDDFIAKTGAKSVVCETKDGEIVVPESEHGLHDVVCVMNVSRRVKDIEKSLLDALSLIKPNGFLNVIEQTKNLHLVRLADWICGRKEDNPYKSDKEWLELFSKLKLEVVCLKSDPLIPCTSFNLRRTSKLNDSDNELVNMEDLTEFSWLEQSQKVLSDVDANKTLWLMNKQERFNGVSGLSLCLRDEDHSDMRVRMVTNISLDEDHSNSLLSITESSVFEDIKKCSLLENCYRDGEWGHMVPMAAKYDDGMTTVMTEHAYMNTTLRGDLSTLQWVEAPHSRVPALRETKKVTVYVYTAGLIFRDVMLATGQLPADAIGTKWKERDALLGCEMAGRLADGTRIVACGSKCLASTCELAQEDIIPLPDNWTMDEGVGVPIAYTTVYLALFTHGKLQRGESVLIHSGAGGVGMAAITVCLAYECTVFITVGTQEKKLFLMERFPQLQDWQFSNSRTTEFELHVMRQTKGRGVDIVLNSLAMDKLHASVRCLGRYGRFLEIGKYDLWRDSTLGLRAFMKNISFHSVMLDLFDDGRNPMHKETQKKLIDDLTAGIIKPLPVTAFKADDVQSAFKHMLNGDHIGKIVIRFREEEGLIASLPSQLKVKALARVYFDPAKVYLITGGLGGFGMELANWLINRGARKLVLTSRSGVKTGYQKRAMAIWKQERVNICVSNLDVSNASQAKQLIDLCQSISPLGGVFHLAMVLRDALFENQTVENFQETALAKLQGTRNLDLTTRRKCGFDLEWFIAFSSATAARGNAGQTCYGWANSAMERLIEQRRYDGHSGCAIQWGPIGDVGVILDNKGTNETVINGTLPQRIHSCLGSLDVLLTWNRPIMGSYVRADLKKHGADEQYSGVIEALAAIMGVNDPDSLDLDANLTEFGIDSLMGVEIRQVLERQFMIVLSMKDIRTLTLRDLKEMAENGGKRPAHKSNASANLSDKPELANNVFRSVTMLQLDPADFTDAMYEDIVPLNELAVNGQSGIEPLFFVHSIEGLAAPLRKLASQIVAPCFCLQWTPNTNTKSMRTVAEYYVQVLHSRHPLEAPKRNGYQLIGYSYGACVAMEMAVLLEQTNTLKSLTLIDGSHLYMQIYRQAYRRAYGLENANIDEDPKFEMDLLTAISERFALDDEKFLKTLATQPDWGSRVQMFTDTVTVAGLIKGEADMTRTKFFLNATRDKLLCADRYQPEEKIRAEVTLIRAEQGAARPEEVNEDYGLSAVITGKITVHVVEGDHDAIARGNQSSETAAILNKQLISA